MASGSVYFIKIIMENKLHQNNGIIIRARIFHAFYLNGTIYSPSILNSPASARVRIRARTVFRMV